MIRILAGLCLFCTTVLAADPFPVDPPTLRKLSRPFPFKAEFSNKVSFRLPDTLRFVTEDKLSEFADRMKLALAGDEAGAVAPDDMSWYTMIFIIKEDPLTGQTDLANLNKELLTNWLEKFTSDHTPRRTGSAKALRIGNWTHPPTWDAEKKQLSFGNRLSSESGDTSHDLMNYKIFVYGPDKQIICLQTITPTANYQKPVDRTKKLVEEITFPLVIPEVNANDEMMYYAKLVGGGLIGAIVVIVAAKVLFGGGRSTNMGATRRVGGLPR